MRNAARTVGVTAPALIVVAAAWLRFERPLGPLWRPAVLVALALAVSVPRQRRWRLIGAVVATGLTAWIGMRVDLLPWHAARGFALFGTRFANSVSDFYSTHLPFDPRVHVAMAQVVLAAIFGFSLVAAQLAAERRPVAGAGAVLVGAGWPATLLGPSHAVMMGTAILGAALVVVAGLGPRRIPTLAVPTVAVVAVGALAVGTATAARHGLVHWQSWNLPHSSSGSVGVGFVWNARYGGLDWPAHPTVVLEVRSTRRPSYLRAAILDDFTEDEWKVGLPRPADFLEPPAALRRRNQTREVVTVMGFANRELVGGSIPVRYEVGGSPLEQSVRGFVSLDEDLPSGFQYTVWSYPPGATAAELRRSPPDYPEALERDDFFDVGRGVAMPAFGSHGRAGWAEGLLSVNPDLYPYRPLERLAEHVAGRARTPYDAVARLEKWFVVSGGFRYSNHPPVISPPLVSFVTQTRAGYCQYFAGAMTLMLRYLGIPARVAVGFAGGRYSARNGAWLVTDRDAHAWVEVWFKGYGWIPFDPTPPAPGSSRLPTLPGTSTPVGGVKPPATPTFRNARGPRGRALIAGKLSRQNGLGRPHGLANTHVAVASSGSGRSNRGLPVLILLLVLAAAGGAIAATKAVVRLKGRMAREPRRIAAACRDELASFLLDQRIEVPRSATFRELGELVRQEFGAQPASFVVAATAARFASENDAAAAALMARRELRTLLAEARSELTRRKRLRGLLSLRSLGRGAVVDASASLESVSVGS